MCYWLREYNVTCKGLRILQGFLLSNQFFWVGKANFLQVLAPEYFWLLLTSFHLFGLTILFTVNYGCVSSVIRYNYCHSKITMKMLFQDSKLKCSCKDFYALHVIKPYSWGMDIMLGTCNNSQWSNWDISWDRRQE